MFVIIVGQSKMDIVFAKATVECKEKSKKIKDFSCLTLVFRTLE